MVCEFLSLMAMGSSGFLKHNPPSYSLLFLFFLVGPVVGTILGGARPPAGGTQPVSGGAQPVPAATQPIPEPADPVQNREPEFLRWLAAQGINNVAPEEMTALRDKFYATLSGSS
jgi:hypothetical protein